MNDFLDNLGKVMNETAKKAIKVSGDVVELTKTSLNIKFDEVKRESFFKEIGKIVYATYKASPDFVSDELLDFCKCIDEIENSINAQKAKAAGIQNKKFCVNCGKVLGKTVNYCYSCGAEQPEIIEEDEENEEEACCDGDSGCCCGSDDDASGDDGPCCDDADCCGDDFGCCGDPDDGCCSGDSCDCGEPNDEE